jgi:hypothetical protein
MSDISDSGSEDGSGLMSSMADFYGIESAVDQADAGSEGSLGESDYESDDYDSHPQTRELDNINSSEFDATGYVKELLNASRAEDLVGTDAKMSHEIRTLDSDMQMLVYENYSRFISATETIRRMKLNVEGMEDDMLSVQSKMEAISKQSAMLDSTLSPRWEEVAKLVKLQSVLERLSFLQELPEKLERMIDAKQYAKAVQLYSQTSQVLKKHGEVLSFRNIHQKTEKMMSELRVKVYNNMLCCVLSLFCVYILRILLCDVGHINRGSIATTTTTAFGC